MFYNKIIALSVYLDGIIVEIWEKNTPSFAPAGCCA
jgi:hypothetical protein